MTDKRSGSKTTEYSELYKGARMQGLVWKRLKALRKKGLMAGLAFLSAVTLGACGGDFPELNDQQIDEAGEYAANLLLKYDSDHRRRLLSIEEMKKESDRRDAWLVKLPEEEKEEILKPEETKPSQDSQGIKPEEQKKYGRLEDFYDFQDGIAIQYLGFTVCSSYPEDSSSFFSLDASEGKEILVLRFELSNSGEAAQQVDLMNRKGSYRITVNGDYTRGQLTTLLENDLATYQNKLTPGEKQEVVLLTEIEKGTEIQNLVLRLKNDSIESTILLK